MSTKNFDERITTRYGKTEKSVYEKVMEIVEKQGLPKSRAQYLLVERGLHHTQNPEPLIKTVVKEVPVEKIKTVIKEVPVYKSPPEVDKSTPHTQEHVSIEEHIQGDPPKTEQRHLGDTLPTQERADPPSNKALKEKKSPQKKGANGWAIAGGLGLAGLLIYLLVR